MWSGGETRRSSAKPHKRAEYKEKEYEGVRAMLKVRKRNGTIVPFDGDKIQAAMEKAFKATGTPVPGEYIMNKILMNVYALMRTEENVVDIESIQDAVEQVLSESGYFRVSKAYVLYRSQRKSVREAAASVLDYSKLVHGYLDRLDWRVKENSTVQYTLGGLILSNSGAVTANYWLNEIYDNEIAQLHKKAAIHLHDLSMLAPYCAGWNLKQLICEGIKGVSGRIASSPAKHLSTLCNQMVNFLGIMQNEWAGAQAFSSFDTYLAPFVRVDELDYKGVKQCVQSFIYGVNTPSRRGCQSPFTNVTLDWTVPEDLKNQKAVVGGKEMDFTYGDCRKEMDMINKAFIEIMTEGDAQGRGFQYPIPTYSITKDFDWEESENNKLLFGMTAKYGTPYFSNYVNSDMKPSDIRSMCCRLRLDLRELKRRNGGFFGAGESTGSIGVVTINLPQLAYLCATEEEFWEKLDNLMDACARSLHTKREVVSNLLNAGLYPYTQAYLGTFDNHFSTIGICGGNEMCLNARWLGKDLTHKESQDFVEKMLNHMRARLSDYQEKYAPELFNLEATPAESTAYRFAKHDISRFPDIHTANDNGTPYYTNSTNLPVGMTDDVFEALDVQDHFQPLYTSGTVFHTFLGEKLPDWKAAAKLVKTITDTYRLPYVSISPTYSVCPDHGYIDGEHFTCPLCGKEAEVYSRITGYYRPVKNWNDGKSQEFKDRKVYIPERSCCGPAARVYGKMAGVNEQTVNGIAAQSTLGNTVESAGAGREAVSASGVAQSETQEKAFVSDSMQVAALEEIPVLVTTKTCPKCKIIRNYMDENKIDYRVVVAGEKEADTLISQFHITSAPTLIGSDGEGLKAFTDIPAIRAYLDSDQFHPYAGQSRAV